MKKEDIAKEIYEAVGYASMCWNPKPTGIFDSGEASKCADKLIEDILNIANKRPTISHIMEAFKITSDRNTLESGSFIMNGAECCDTQNIDIDGKIYFAHKIMVDKLLEKTKNIRDIELLWCIPGSCSPIDDQNNSPSSAVDGYEVHFLYRK